MDAETMIDQLEVIARLCDERLADSVEGAELREIAAALRAQAKAEPVAWLEKDTLLSLTPNEFRAHVKDYPDAAAEFFPVFTAQPPDHAEALAEALAVALAEARSALWRVIEDNCGGQPEDYAEIRSIDAALTRYKETRNG